MVWETFDSRPASFFELLSEAADALRLSFAAVLAARCALCIAPRQPADDPA
jgi:hypothetical protein